MANDVNSATYKKWMEILLRLDQGTKNGKVHWSATASSDCYVVALKGAVIIFGTRSSILDELDYFIEIKNDDGETIDEFTDVDLDRGRNSKTFYPLMKDMHATIARKLSGADEILDRILEQLPSFKDEQLF